MISEDLIRRFTLEAISQLGPNATQANVERVVRRAVSTYDDGATPPSADSGRIMLTAYGYNSPGILAAITHVLAKHRCDVMDMTQKLLQEYFTLMMLVDITPSTASLGDIQNDLAALQETHKMRILVQHEDLFNTMHRI